MKKMITFFCVVTFMAACNSTATTKETPDTTGAIRPAVENVNGNMPDTTNTIQLSTVDSSARKGAAQ